MFSKRRIKMWYEHLEHKEYLKQICAQFPELKNIWIYKVDFNYEEVYAEFEFWLPCK
jgi:hypothetical protein